jgi:lipid-A-disaccharide synthase
MISCGEASGDLYAGALASGLRTLDPSVEVFGFGGSRLAAAGGELIADFGALSVTGFTDAIRFVPRTLRLLRRLVAAARERRPDVFVAVDAPDFNFRLLSAMRRLGIPVVYYISPQLWAWRKGRMATMQAKVDRVLVIFPFEEELYRSAGVAVEFVGHPLAELIPAGQPRGPFLRGLGLNPELPTIALLPGSRRNEVERTAPILAKAMPLIRARVPDVQFVVAAAPTVRPEAFTALTDERGDRLPPSLKLWRTRRSLGEGGQPAHPVTVVRDRTDDVLTACDVAITASGTATVQCALHERPMVVVYRLSWIDAQVARRFLTLDTFAMPNLLAGRRIVPELIQDDFTAARVAEEAVSLLTDGQRRARMREALREVRDQIGAAGASARAAAAVLEVARRGT